MTVLYFVFLGDEFDPSSETNVHAHIMNGKLHFVSSCTSIWVLIQYFSGCYRTGVCIQSNPLPAISLLLHMFGYFDVHSWKLHRLSN